MRTFTLADWETLVRSLWAFCKPNRCSNEFARVGKMKCHVIALQMRIDRDIFDIMRLIDWFIYIKLNERVALPLLPVRSIAIDQPAIDIGIVYGRFHQHRCAPIKRTFFLLRHSPNNFIQSFRHNKTLNRISVSMMFIDAVPTHLMPMKRAKWNAINISASAISARAHTYTFGTRSMFYASIQWTNQN